MAEAEVISISFRFFLQLPELQRCAVILKDVLGYSADKIAAVAECTTAAAKSALQRGRANLRRIASDPASPRLPLITDAQKVLLGQYAALFQAGDFVAIREMLTEEVKLDLVNRVKLKGREEVGAYFTRYAQVAQWEFTLGGVEGRPALLAFEINNKTREPTHFALIDWQGTKIAAIRDFLYAPYVMEALDWLKLR